MLTGLAAADPYLQKMELLFAREGLPKELTRIPLVESSFNNNAVSRVGAVGVWQFMGDSAREYLTVNNKLGIDERLSPFKSALAAAKMLKRHQRVLGSWAATVTSYNHGIRTFLKVAPELKKRNLTAVALLAPCVKKSKKGRALPSLGWASRNYYPEFLALVHAEAYRDRFYGNRQGQVVDLKPIVFDRLKTPESARALCARRGVLVEEFRILNPDVTLLDQRLPSGFWVALPGEQDDFGGLSTLTDQNATAFLKRPG